MDIIDRILPKNMRIGGHFSMGSHHLKEQNYLPALYHFQQAAALQSMSQLHFAIAYTLYQMGAYEQAESWIDSTIEMEEKNGEFHVLKGHICLKLDKAEAALDAYQQASRKGVKNTPVWPVVLNGMAMANDKMGETETAHHIFREALQSDQTTSTLKNYAFFLLKKGETDEACKLMSRVPVSDDVDLKVVRGMLDYFCGNKDAMSRLYKEALEANAGEVRLLLLEGLLNLEEDPEKSISLFGMFYTHAPQKDFAASFLAEACRRAGKAEDAARWQQRAEERKDPPFASLMRRK